MLKKIIKTLDVKLCNGLFSKFYSSVYLENKALKQHDSSPYRFVIDYKGSYSELARLSDYYGSDKGEVNGLDNPYSWPSHSYTDYYEMIFSKRKESIRNCLECGIGTNNPMLISSMGSQGKPGASLRMWRDYFPNANIIGCDIDEDILFDDTRIKTFKCDQTNSDSISQFILNAEIKEGSLDLIIDDGLHTFAAGVSFFENTISLLSDKGYYFIEDVEPHDFALYKEYFTAYGSNIKISYVSLFSPNRTVCFDNRLIVIEKN